jgi:hypothetical protein
VIWIAGEALPLHHPLAARDEHFGFVPDPRLMQI